MRWLALVAFALVACGSCGAAQAREYDAADAQNGMTIKVHAGDTVRVTLGSTTWTIAGSSDPTVLEQEGAQVVSPAPIGECIAGEACGTTSAVFRALKRGKATVDASRASCGEGRLCVGAEGSYQVTMLVG